jgi:hypothetical protein
VRKWGEETGMDGVVRVRQGDKRVLGDEKKVNNDDKLYAASKQVNTHTHVGWSYFVFMARMRLKSLPSSKLFWRCFLTYGGGRKEVEEGKEGGVELM